MKKGQIAELENGKEVKLLHPIGGRERHKSDYSQFWEVENENGKTEVMLLVVKDTVSDDNNSIKENQQ
jgi:hypothetical protein